MQNKYNLNQVSIPSNASFLVVSKLIRNTYALLSMTMLFSSMVASIAMMINAKPMSIFIQLPVLIGMLFALNKFKDSAWALPLVFLFTGFMGYTIGPIINYYLSLPSGGTTVTVALILTSIMFAGLSLYAFISRTNFNFMHGFLFSGLCLVIAFSLINIFFRIPTLSLVISSIGILIFSGFILFDTSRMIQGGEKNYVMVTVSLYLSIYNLFLMILHLTGFFSGNNE
jgi:modulator of FtsH protease